MHQPTMWPCCAAAPAAWLTPRRPPLRPTPRLQEVRAWMDRPDNAQEFLMLYFDDQANLQTWVRPAWLPAGLLPQQRAS